MYVILPFVYFFIRRVRSFFGLISILVLASCVGLLAVWLNWVEVFKYIPCFIPGCMAYWIVSKDESAGKISFEFLLLIILLLFFVYQGLGRWSQTVGGYPVCLVLGMVLPYARRARFLYIYRVGGIVAKYSYGIYLIHAPVLAFVFSIASMSVTYKLLFFFIVVSALSVLSYRYIEQPFIALGQRMTSRQK